MFQSLEPPPSHSYGSSFRGPILAYFEFAPPASDKVSRVVKDTAMLKKAGVHVDPATLSEKTGYAMVE